MLTGTVTVIDGAKGLGTVRGENGVDYLFHVIEITDGTRTVDPGQRVSFQPLPKFGRFQAGRIHKV
ncbi:MAG TPA: cold shock domain-containing protein [Ilumatobacter sp.]|nr:cold shock domain-containing protein [Ilumatobacter sp.]